MKTRFEIMYFITVGLHTNVSDTYSVIVIRLIVTDFTSVGCVHYFST